MTAEELNKTLPNVFKAFVMICDDNSHAFNWDVPAQFMNMARVANDALGTLSEADFETFCVGEGSEAEAIAARSNDLTTAHEFLAAFFVEWDADALVAPVETTSEPALSPPPKLEYRNDETCWIFAHEIDEETGKAVLSQGKVLFRFTVNDMVGIFHVIRLGDPDYPYLEVRDALTMTPDPNVLPPFSGTATPMKGARSRPTPE